MIKWEPDISVKLFHRMNGYIKSLCVSTIFNNHPNKVKRSYKMRSVKALIAVCVAAGITLVSVNYSVAADSSTMDRETMFLAKGNGPGDGTGNGGSGPKDGTGNGKKRGTCTKLSSDAQDNINSIIAGRGNCGGGNGGGQGSGNGGGQGSGTGTCPRA